MVWFLLSLALMSYPIAELTRFIFAYYPLRPDLQETFILELILMWLGYISGLTILVGRLKK